jgi:hypothetical protein
MKKLFEKLMCIIIFYISKYIKDENVELRLVYKGHLIQMWKPDPEDRIISHVLGNREII